ncbi:Endocuticle structural glycoprotein ABD-4 [Eumeta japonica]|uniref:Endocuticle structural glycoprotein ABD-4 n=1 Tax=Eumeta variegata TaxID=151549 RepID=A0A4C1SPC7_EUMVA|nr:Endocuticle structural glycoprotein ABD-4 [Eumeta japonica]
MVSKVRRLVPLKSNLPDSSDVIIARGSVSYTSPEGNLITLNYAADDEMVFNHRVIICPHHQFHQQSKALDYLLNLPPSNVVKYIKQTIKDYLRKLV